MHDHVNSIYSYRQCIHQLFEEHVARRPEATALIFEGESLSYDELNVRANRAGASVDCVGRSA